MLLLCSVNLFFFLQHSISASLSPSLCLYPEAKCPAVFPGWPAPSLSSGSVSLCTFSLVILSEQEISHSIRLKRSRSADKARAEGAPSPRCSICRPRLVPFLSTQDICISSHHFFPFSLYLFCALPQTHAISEFLPELSELHTYFLRLSNCFSFCAHSAILNKCPVKFRLYLALEVGEINECSLLFICRHYSQLYLFYIHSFKRHMSEIVVPAAMFGPPLCIIGSHFCLSDCSARLGYARENRLMDESNRKYMCKLHENKHLKQQKIGGHFKGAAAKTVSCSSFTNICCLCMCVSAPTCVLSPFAAE